MSTADAGNHDNKGYAERKERREVVKEETETSNRSAPQPTVRSHHDALIPESAFASSDPPTTESSRRTANARKPRRGICRATPRTQRHCRSKHRFLDPHRKPPGSKYTSKRLIYRVKKWVENETQEAERQMQTPHTPIVIKPRKTFVNLGSPIGNM